MAGKKNAVKTNREAAALGTAAAAGKGVLLNTEALEQYAGAVDPELSGEESSGEHFPRGDAPEDEDRGKGREGPFDPAGIRKLAEDTEEKNPLTGLLNRLPGRDGRRWIVLPFELEREGLRCRVSLRLLLDGKGPPFRAERLAADICVFRAAGEKRRWLFVLDNRGDPSSRMEVSLSPPLSGTGTDALEKELRELLGPRAGHIRVRSGPETLAFGADSREEVLPPVNEAV